MKNPTEMMGFVSNLKRRSRDASKLKWHSRGHLYPITRNPRVSGTPGLCHTCN